MALRSYAKSQPTFPEMYERWLVGPLFRPWAELMLEEAKFSPADRLLDIACGTGIVARVASERLGETARVVGVDASFDMLAVARAVAPGIDWRQGSSDDLPLRNDEAFDVVVCQQGLQFFPDKPRAAAQMRRALANGGRLAVATWRSDEEVPFFLELRRVAESRLGPITDQRYGFGESAPVAALLRDAGFRDVRSRVVSLPIHFDDGAPFLRLNTMALVGMNAAGKAMSDQERKRAVTDIVNESEPVLRSYADGTGITFEVRANLATARA